LLDPWFQVSADSQWSVVYRNARPSTAFVVGTWERFAAGQLKKTDLVPVNPPDITAALGFATVDEPETGGWCLSTGRRLVIKSTDVARGRRMYSYESFARLGWAVGVDSRSEAAARIFWQGGSGGTQTAEALLARAVAEAPATGAWLVAAEAEFALARGQSLLRAPAPGQGLNNSTDKKDPRRSFSLPTDTADCPAFLVALIVDPQSRVGGALAERFLPPDTPTLPGTKLRALTLFGVLRQPAPTPDLTAPLADVWLKTDYRDKQRFPKTLNVQRLLDGSQARRAYLNVWALNALEPCNLYQNPNLVDMAEFAPQIERDQKWATGTPQFPEPIYEKPRFLLRREVAEGIARVDKRLNQMGYQLKLYDAYRPFSITQKLYRQYADELLQTRGIIPEHVLYLASPEVGSRHNRAAAVDCTVTDAQGNELVMPSKYLTFDITSHRTAPNPETQSAQHAKWVAAMTPEARKNMDLLAEVMRAEKFTTINEEWWHFDAPGYTSYSILDEPLWPDAQDTPTQTSEWRLSASTDPTPTSATTETVPNPALRLALPSDDLRPPEALERGNEVKRERAASEPESSDPLREAKEKSQEPQGFDLAFLVKLGAVGFVLLMALLLTLASLFKKQ
jgi:D-alanyl-D-alanine dipeptidase